MKKCLRTDLPTHHLKPPFYMFRYIFVFCVSIICPAIFTCFLKTINKIYVAGSLLTHDQHRNTGTPVDSVVQTECDEYI